MSYYYIIPSSRPAGYGCSGWKSRSKCKSWRAASVGPRFTPACKIKECDDKYEILIDVPGVKAKDIKVQLEEKDTVLSIKAIRKPRDNDDSESVEQTMEKRLGMGTDVDVSSISASVEDGVLTVTVLKLKHDESVRSIPVGINRDEDKTVVAGNISMKGSDGKAVDTTEDAEE